MKRARSTTIKRGLILSTLAATATSSTKDKPHNSAQHLRSRNLQDDIRRCGLNWQEAYDACDTACELDEDCGPGLYCFGYLGCTPPEPPAEPAVPALEPAPEPSGAEGEPTPDGPAAPPSEYTPSANLSTPAEPASSPASSPAAPSVPTALASLPLAPSEPTTPAPFSLPVPTPNTLPNPNSYYCGYGYESALSECYYACPSGNNEECPGGRTCHGWLSCDQAQEDPALYNVCGTSWADAASKCASRCFLGSDDSCPSGETCWGNVVECKDSENLPALTAVDVGQAEQAFTQEEIDAMIVEEEMAAATEEAMNDPNNWWCGTSYSNMLETCSKRCTTDDDCALSSWEKGTCFKTAGGEENCSTEGVPVKEASVPGSKWCGSTWNDMLETCAKQCESNDDCDGKTCWDAPDTCQWIGVPVKEVSDPATLWCGTSFDDAAVMCHKACPSENDDDCPEGMSCFAGSACTEEGVPVVRENYRCGSTWEDAATKCGVECQKDDDCTAENGADEGDICYSDVICASESGAGASGKICVSNWETSQEECATASPCEVDANCTSGTLCMWIDCVPPEEEGLDDTSATPGTTTPGTLPGCSAEVHRCADGQFVARAPELNCEFYPCPEDSANATSTVAAEAFSGGGDGNEMTENSEEVVDESQDQGATESSEEVVANFQDQDAGASDWGTIPLTFASPKCEGECTMCQGDCNSDDDCAEDLKCFSRGSGEVTAVPGCVSGGEGDLAGMDYCYLPEPPTTTTTTTTTTAATEPAVPPPELKFARECTAELPCNACEGDCDDNSQCAEGLICFSRVQGSVMFVPGCVGTGIAGMDYCYDPNEPIILPTTEMATASPPEEQEFTGCSAEVQACPGSTKLVYRNPANNCEFDPCPGESAAASSGSSTTSTASPNDGSSTTVAAVTSTAAAATSAVSATTPNAATTDTYDGTTPNTVTTSASGETSPIPVTMSAMGGSTPNSSAQAATTEAAAVTCDTLCLDALPSSFCPTELDGLPDCLSIEIGYICEARGECATDDSLNNCQTFDVYVRVECGGSTPTQGELMKNPPATEGPVTTQSPLGDDTSQGANATIVSTGGENPFEGQSASDNVTVATSDNTTVASDNANQGSTVVPVANSTSVANPVPTTLAPAPQENATGDISNLTLQTVGSDSVSNAAAFAYDRSPGGEEVYTADESPSEYYAEDYSNEPDAISYTAFNPYDQNEGWDLDGFASGGYIMPDVTNSASIYSRGTAVILGLLVPFALTV